MPKNYSFEFKLAAVKLVADGNNLATVIRAVGVDRKTLTIWIKSARSRRSPNELRKGMQGLGYTCRQIESIGKDHDPSRGKWENEEQVLKMYRGEA